MKLIYKLLIFASLCFAFSGCGAVAIGYMAHRFSEAKTESAEKAQRSADLRTYTTYRTEMERVNLEREKAKLKPSLIMSQEEWMSAQTAGRPAVAAVPPPPSTPEPIK
jgi:hypothetical protein